MSSVIIPVDSIVSVNALMAANGIRVPETVTGTGATRTFTWTPDLSAADQTNIADIVTMTGFGVTMTLAEWQSIKSDAAGLKTYFGLASPTLVQTAAATKAIIHVLSVIVRD
jgi:hypothetical protein